MPQPNPPAASHFRATRPTYTRGPHDKQSAHLSMVKAQARALFERDGHDGSRDALLVAPQSRAWKGVVVSASVEGELQPTRLTAAAPPMGGARVA